MLIALFILQAQAAVPQTVAADIELNANIRARSVEIEKKGNARLTVTTSPDGGNLVDVRAPKANGRKRLRNVSVDVRAEARIGDAAAPANNREQPETAPPE